MAALRRRSLLEDELGAHAESKADGLAQASESMGDKWSSPRMRRSREGVTVLWTGCVKYCNNGRYCIALAWLATTCLPQRASPDWVLPFQYAVPSSHHHLSALLASPSPSPALGLHSRLHRACLPSGHALSLQLLCPRIRASYRCCTLSVGRPRLGWRP